MRFVKIPSFELMKKGTTMNGLTLDEDMNNQSIMITINHLGRKFTERLFPRKNTEYGYDSLLNKMIHMYNQTM